MPAPISAGVLGIARTRRDVAAEPAREDRRGGCRRRSTARPADVARQMRRQRVRGVAHLLRLDREHDDARRPRPPRRKRRRHARRPESAPRAVALRRRSARPHGFAARRARAPHAADERGRHVAAADERRCSLRGPVAFVARAEDRAFPTRTCRALGDRRLEVGGHAHRQRVDGKAGRSARVEAFAQAPELRPLPRRRRRSARQCPSARAAAVAAAPPRPARAAPPPPPATPLFVASPLMLTWMQTSSGGVSAGRAATAARRSSTRSTVCTQSKRAAASVALLPCSGPIRCHSHAWQIAQSRPSSPRLPARSFRRTRAAPSRIARRVPHRAGERLGDRQHGDRARVAAGRRGRPRDARLNACQPSRSRS